MPDNTVKVARPGRFGNPYRLISEEGFPLIEHVETGAIHNDAAGETWESAAGHVVSLFRERCVDSLPVLAGLRGKNLACWCRLCDAHREGKPLGVECTECAPCHADVLLEMANTTPPGAVKEG